MFTDTEIQELILITQQITELKQKRVQKYGANWALLLGRKPPEGHRWDKSTQLKNAKKLEEYMALNNLTIGELSSEIGINRNFFNYLRTRSFNFKNKKKIEDFLTKIESQNE